MKERPRTNKGHDPGISAGVAESAGNYSDNVVFRAERGHGFAAEKANHLADVLSGRKADLVGGDNRLDGPDRMVNGLAIQTKYCRSGSKCIESCFRDGTYRYMGNNGPMLIEVPSDKHSAAVQAMEQRIRTGQVPGVSDPAQAKMIVRKGWLTYAQARNVARFGTIESLTYDAVRGVRLAGTSMGLSAAIVFAVSVRNGDNAEDALRKSCVTGLQIGSLAWVSSVLAAQLGRTGMEQGLRGTTDWAVRQLGPKVTSWLANGLYGGAPVYGASAANHLSKVLRGNLAGGGVTAILLSSADLIHLLRGRMSVGQMLKNFTTTTAGIAGGSVGWLVGLAAGARIGSVIPFAGAGVGRLIGGVVGAMAFGSGASTAANGLLNRFIEDDAKQMLEIIEKSFGLLAHEYVFGEQDTKAVIDRLLEADDLTVKLRDMYAAEDRPGFARLWLLPLVREQASKRSRVSLPSDQAILRSLKAAAIP